MMEKCIFIVDRDHDPDLQYTKYPIASEDKNHICRTKGYSFENYFLNPAIMAKLGVIKSESDFYKIFLQKWKEYLNRIRSGIHLKQIMGHDLQSIQDVKDNMELIKRYMRGHNVFDIFYGRYKNSETELLTKYVELAPREDFADILNSIDRFIIFESRKK